MTSVKIFEIFGISVYLHITFLLFILLLFVFFLFTEGIIAGIVSLFLVSFLFLIVLIHEFSHSIVAKAFGFNVRKITLLPLGGAADVEIKENPKAEIFIALAGPLFNILFAWICFVLLFSLTPNWKHYLAIFSPKFSLDFFGFLGWLIWINFILAIFNLLPAFPMDGGRILRAFLAVFMDYLRATKISVKIAKILFMLMGGIGLLLIITKISVFNGVLLVFISMFLLVAGESEEKFIELKEKFKGMKNKDIAIFMNEIDGNLAVNDLINFANLNNFPNLFFVVTTNGNIAGIIKMNEVMNKLAKNEISLNLPVYELAHKRVEFIEAEELVCDSFEKILSSDLCVVKDNGIVIGYIVKDMIIKNFE